MAPKPIHFTAQVIKVETMADGAIRLTMDLSATDTDTAAAMMKAKATNSLVECAALFVKPIDKQQGNNDAVSERSEWQSNRKATRKKSTNRDP